jgi:hypothetical protein
VFHQHSSASATISINASRADAGLHCARRGPSVIGLSRRPGRCALHPDGSTTPVKCLSSPMGAGWGQWAPSVWRATPRAIERCPIAVEPVDADQAGQAQLGGGLPCLLRLHLDPGHGVHDHERGIGHAQRRARVIEEVPEAGRVDEVDLGLVPLRVRQACAQRVLAGDFFFVVVGDRRAVVHKAEPVDHAGGEQQRGHQLRLPAPAVANHGHIADAGSIVNLHRREASPGASDVRL